MVKDPLPWRGLLDGYGYITRVPSMAPFQHFYQEGIVNDNSAPPSIPSLDIWSGPGTVLLPKLGQTVPPARDARRHRCRTVQLPLSFYADMRCVLVDRGAHLGTGWE